MLVHLTVVAEPASYSLAWWWQHFRRWRFICPETRHIELAFGLVSLWWAFVLLIPPDLFASNTSFLGLAARGSERQWGIVAATVSLLHLTGYIGAAPILRFLAFVVGMVFWLFVSASLASTAPVWHHIPINTGVGAYGVFAFKCFLAMCRLSPFVVADAIGVLRRRHRGAKAKSGRSR